MWCLVVFSFGVCGFSYPHHDVPIKYFKLKRSVHVLLNPNGHLAKVVPSLSIIVAHIVANEALETTNIRLRLQSGIQAPYMCSLLQKRNKDWKAGCKI